MVQHGSKGMKDGQPPVPVLVARIDATARATEAHATDGRVLPMPLPATFWQPHPSPSPSPAPRGLPGWCLVHRISLKLNLKVALSVLFQSPIINRRSGSQWFWAAVNPQVGRVSRDGYWK